MKKFIIKNKDFIIPILQLIIAIIIVIIFRRDYFNKIQYLFRELKNCYGR